MPLLYICASGEANHESTNYLFASSFVVIRLAIRAHSRIGFLNTVKGDELWFTLYVNMWMFVHMWKQFIRIQKEAYECLC